MKNKQSLMSDFILFLFFLQINVVVLLNRSLHVSSNLFFCVVLQEGFFDLQEALQAIHMRQETLREQLVHAKSKGEETVGQNIQVTKETNPETWTGKENKFLPVKLSHECQSLSL